MEYNGALNTVIYVIFLLFKKLYVGRNREAVRVVTTRAMYSRNTEIAWVTEGDSKTNGKNKGKAIPVTGRGGP
jgi:hypothetical protein